MSKPWAVIFLSLFLSVLTTLLLTQTTMRVNGNGSSAFVYVGPLSGMPATCNIAEISYITDNPIGENIEICYQTNTWFQAGAPSGSIIFSQTACGTGWTEVSKAGDYVLLTTAANGDVNTTGGSLNLTGTVQNFTTAGNVSLLGIGTALTGPASITPAGTIQPTFYKLIPCKKN